MKIGTDALLLAGYASLVVSPYAENVWENTPFVIPEKDEVLTIENHNNEDFNDEYWPKRILDIGCGSGVISIMLLQTYSQALVDSVDINIDAIRLLSIDLFLILWHFNSVMVMSENIWE